MVDVGAAFLPTQDHPLGEHRYAAQGGGPVGPYDGIRKNAVVKGNIDAVVAFVKGYRLYIYVGIHQFGAPDPGIGGGFQYPLGPCRQVYGQVFNTILIPTGIGDFSGVNGHGLPQIIGIAAQTVLTQISHVFPS